MRARRQLPVRYANRALPETHPIAVAFRELESVVRRWGQRAALIYAAERMAQHSAGCHPPRRNGGT